MKSTLTFGFLLVVSQAAPSLKNLLAEQTYTTVSQNAGDYGFNWTCPEGQTPVIPPIIPGGPGNNNTDVCACNIGSGSLPTLPTLGQSQIAAYTSNAVATVGSNLITNPDTQVLNQAAAQVCSCETSTSTKRRTQVKNNSFQFGGRIDVVEAAQESSTSQSSSGSSGSARRQTATATNNQGGAGSVPSQGGCVSICAQ